LTLAVSTKWFDQLKQKKNAQITNPHLPRQMACFIAELLRPQGFVTWHHGHEAVTDFDVLQTGHMRRHWQDVILWAYSRCSVPVREKYWQRPPPAWVVTCAMSHPIAAKASTTPKKTPEVYKNIDSRLFVNDFGLFQQFIYLVCNVSASDISFTSCWRCDYCSHCVYQVV
jgi:hypothetical protein